MKETARTVAAPARPPRAKKPVAAGASAPAALPPTRATMPSPVNIQLIGTEVAIAWDDGLETYFPAEELRAASPSAENVGEHDILGNKYGGDGPSRFPGVTVLGWEQVGNYAIRFEFSDRHRTGLYSYDYLRALAAKLG